MGRAEKRALEKRRMKDARASKKLLETIAAAQANQKKLRDEEIDKLEAFVTDANVACVFTAMAWEIYNRFKISKEEVVEILNAIDDDIGIIGTDDCPTISEFKIQYALRHGMNICLNEKEAEEVEKRYAEAEARGEVVD